MLYLSQWVDRNARGFLPKIRSFLRKHLLLIIVGITCELFYLFYFVGQFGLLRYYHGLIDMARITGYRILGLQQFVAVFGALFLFCGLACWEVRGRNDRSTLWLILGFGCVFGLTMSFVYPATAIDIFVYVAQNLALVQYHLNPMVVPPAAAANDPLIRLAGNWAYVTAPYGPLGLLIDAIPTLIFGRSLLATLLLMKFIFSAMLVVEAFLVYKILSHYAPAFALAGAILVAWNPYMLFEYSANAHNDIAMMLFVLLACLALVKDRQALAFVLLVVSVLVKYAMLPILPLFFLYSLVHQPTHKRRLIYVCRVVCWSVILVLAIYGPFWQGTKTLAPLLSQDTRYWYSLSMTLTTLSSGSITAGQVKLIADNLFGLIYVYALFLATRNQAQLFKACFIVLFSVLALVATNVEIWYAIWPAFFALLYPRTTIYIVLIVFLYATELTVTATFYLWGMLGETHAAMTAINLLAYLMMYALPVLLLAGFALQRRFFPLHIMQDPESHVTGDKTRALFFGVFSARQERKEQVSGVFEEKT